MAFLIKLFKPFQPVFACLAWTDQSGCIGYFAIDGSLSDVALGLNPIELGTTPTPALSTGQMNICNREKHLDGFKLCTIPIKSSDSLLEFR